MIDFDTAAPGPRAWDLAYLSYRLVPLSGPADPEETGGLHAGERAAHLWRLCAAYGGDIAPAAVLATVPERLRALPAVASVPAHARRDAADAAELEGASSTGAQRTRSRTSSSAV